MSHAGCALAPLLIPLLVAIKVCLLHRPWRLAFEAFARKAFRVRRAAAIEVGTHKLTQQARSRARRDS